MNVDEYRVATNLVNLPPRKPIILRDLSEHGKLGILRDF